MGKKHASQYANFGWLPMFIDVKSEETASSWQTLFLSLHGKVNLSKAHIKA